MDRWLVIGVALVGTVALAGGLERTDLWPPDEPRVAEIAREMAANHSWLIPTLNGHPFLEEPVLFYWLQASAYRLARGPSAAAARAPAAAAAAAGVLVTAAAALRFGANPGVAAIVLTTAPEYWWMARSATPDTTAAAATALALLCFFVAWQSGSGWMLTATVAALGVAFGCKSLLPVGLAVLTIAAFVTSAGRGRLSIRYALAASAGITAVAGAWVWVLAARVDAGAATAFLVTNHLGRLVGNADEGHIRPILYYAANLALDLFPWSLVLPAAVVAAWRTRASAERRFPFVWAATMLLALTCSASKRAHYLLAAYPAFAILIAQWWPEAWRSRPAGASRRAMLWAAVIAGPVLTLVAMSVTAPDGDGAVRALHEASPTWASMLADVTPTGAAWLGAGAAGLAGVGLLRLDRIRNVACLGAGLGAYLTALHLVIALILLPRLNALTSARPQAEQLGRLAEHGVALLTYGQFDGEKLSPILFYAHHDVVEVGSVAALARRFRSGPACALMRAEDYAALAGVLPGSSVDRAKPAGSRFILVESAPGLCSSDDASARAPHS